jgi:hypothetical protein
LFFEHVQKPLFGHVKSNVRDANKHLLVLHHFSGGFGHPGKTKIAANNEFVSV